MNNKISARQLCTAGFTGMLSLSAAAAGSDWRGALLAVPVVALAMWTAASAAERSGGLLKGVNGAPGKMLALLYIGWGVFAAGTALAVCGRRLSEAGGQGGALWPTVLAVLPVLRLAMGKPEAFARAGEIFYLAMLAVVILVAAPGAGEVRWDWLTAEGQSMGRSFYEAAGIGCMGIYAVLLWNGEGRGEGKRWLAWSAAGALTLAGLTALTVGSLSPALSSAVERPFFVMAVGLGRTARTEALIALLWLVADVTLLGLLLQSCRGLWRDVLGLPGEKWAGAGMTAAALALALWGGQNAEARLQTALPGGGVLLGAAIPIMIKVLGKKRRSAE